jgi:FkbM family methyltransferase
MMAGIVQLVLRKIQEISGSRVGLWIQRASYAVYRQSCNPGYHFSNNGELRVLGVLPQVTALTVLDVGANTGHWSIACSDSCNNRATIYAFEPGDQNYARLKNTIENRANIVPINLGLSDADATMEMLISDGTSVKSSVETSSARNLNTGVTDFHQEPHQFIRGDVFCKKQGLNRIDFLKIDTEGHDYKVLLGFSDMISSGRVDVIQFEYNRLNVYVKSMLMDFYNLLNKQLTTDGYLIGRIYPNSVNFKEYSIYDENFVDGNFLAVRRNLSEQIKFLRG